MPKQKDLKRVVRTRMRKTGESYTTARIHVLGKSGKRDAGAKKDLLHIAHDNPHRDGIRDAGKDGSIPFFGKSGHGV